MRLRNTARALLATTALLGAIAAAAPASAIVVTVPSFTDPNLLPDGQVLIADFNNELTPEATLVAGYTLDLNGATVGVNEGGSGYSGTLPNDPTHYLTIPGGASATLTSVKYLRSFSLYMGSPDTYNSVQFLGANGFNVTLNGGQLTQGNTGQSWAWGARVNFDFEGAQVNQIILRSTSNSFESDNFAAGAVPEPATWAMMIIGFGAAGSILRRRRQQLALAS